MKYKSVIIVLLNLFLINNLFSQAERYWIKGGNNNFNNGNNWSLSSGGIAIGGSLTWNANDKAIFDSNSGTPTVNIPSSTTINVGKIDINSPGATITFNFSTSSNLIINSDLTIIAGVFNITLFNKTSSIKINGTTTIATQNTPANEIATFQISSMPNDGVASSSFFLGTIIINDFSNSGAGKGLYSVTANPSGGYDYIQLRGSIINNGDVSAFQPAKNVYNAGNINYIMYNATADTNKFKGDITFSKTWIMFNAGVWQNDGNLTFTGVSTLQLGSGKLINKGNLTSDASFSTSGCSGTGGTLINTASGYLKMPGAGCSNMTVQADFSAAGNTVEYTGGYLFSSKYTNTNPVYPATPDKTTVHYNVIISGTSYFGGTNQSATINGKLNVVNNASIGMCSSNAYLILAGSFNENPAMFYGCGNSTYPSNTTLLIKNNNPGYIGTMLWGSNSPFQYANLLSNLIIDIPNGYVTLDYNTKSSSGNGNLVVLNSMNLYDGYIQVSDYPSNRLEYGCKDCNVTASAAKLQSHKGYVALLGENSKFQLDMISTPVGTNFTLPIGLPQEATIKGKRPVIFQPNSTTTANVQFGYINTGIWGNDAENIEITENVNRTNYIMNIKSLSALSNFTLGLSYALIPPAAVSDFNAGNPERPEDAYISQYKQGAWHKLGQTSNSADTIFEFISYDNVPGLSANTVFPFVLMSSTATTDVSNINNIRGVEIINSDNHLMINNTLNEDVTIEVYNLSGQKMMSRTINKGLTNINLNQLHGLYILKVNKTNESFTRKIVVR